MAYYQTMNPGGESKPLRNPGDIIRGRYEVVQMIGKGATGEVYVVADQENSSKEIALKYMKLGSEMVATINHFKSEFDTMTHLNHPHIARVFDFEFDEEMGFNFFTSELIDGFDFVTTSKYLDIARVELLLIQALRALEYLHGHSILHYDIKPQNILVQDANGPSPAVKVIDFGLASTHTTDRIIGTPSYIAPEVIKKEKSDGRADLYSLGVLAYYALTRVNPFRAESPQQTLENHLSKIPPSPKELNPSVPDHLDSMVMRLLEKDPENRYSSAADVIRDINFRSARKYSVETPDTLLSYVPWEGPFVGRTAELKEFKQWFDNISECDASLFWIQGGLGRGKSRFADELRKTIQLQDLNTLFTGEINTKFINKLKKVVPATVIIMDDLDKFLSTADEKIIKTLQEQLKDKHFIITSSDTKTTTEVIKQFLLGTDIQSITASKLGNFSISELSSYMRTLTGLSEVPDWLVRSLFDLTEGNPLFLTETIKEMVIGGQLFDRSGRWKKTTIEDVGIDLKKLKVPEPIVSRMRPILERFSSSEKEIAGVISACECMFTKEAMTDLMKRNVGTDLDALTRYDILTCDAKSGIYDFKNQLIKLAFYSMIPDKRHVHDLIREYIEQGNGNAVKASYHAKLGNNDELARRELLKDDGDDSLDTFLERFGDKIDSDVIAAYMKKAERENHNGNFDEALAIYNKLLEKLPDEDAAPKWHFDLHIAMGTLYRKERKLEDATQHLNKAKHLSMLTNEPMDAIIAENYIAGLDMVMGNIDYAIEKFEKTRQQSTKMEITNNELGHAYCYKGDFARAIDILKDDVKLNRKLGDDRRLARAMYSLGEAHRSLRKFDIADEIFNEIILISKKQGDIEALFRAYNGLGNVMTGRGEYKDSVGYFERALDLALHLANYDAAVGIMINTAIIHSNLQEIKKAFDTFETALAFLNRDDITVPHRDSYLCRINLELGELYRIEKKFDKADRHLNEALTLAKKPQAKFLMFWILLTKAKLAHDIQDILTAKDFIKKASRLADTGDKKNLLEEIKKL